MTRPSLLATLTALAIIAIASPARAHQTSVVYVDVNVAARIADIEVRITAEDLGEPVGRSPLLVPTREQVRAGVTRAQQYVADRITVKNGGATCEPSLGGTSIRDRESSFVLALALRYTCARQIDDLAVRYDLFFDLDPRHQGFAEVRAFGTTRESVFRESDRDLHVQGEPSRIAQFGDYLELGIEHIFTGYDHIAFLLSLLLIAAARGGRNGVKYALGVVTAFTLAHSITLISAALGWVRLPSRLVETSIAASILYVALENVFRRDPRGRWLLTFAFGLIHGFGFATVLGELGLPRGGLVLSLVSFNVGVELGQLMVVAAAFPILLAIHRATWTAREIAVATALATLVYMVLARFGVPRATLGVVVFGGTAVLALAARRWGYDRAVRVGASLAVAALAVLWIIERVASKSWFGGRLG